MNSRSAFSTQRLRSPAGAAERSATFQYRLLRLLAANPVRTQNELAAELGTHGATVNAHLKILKEQGYIESGDYGHLDRFVRKCQYQVTPAGSQQCRALGRAQRESRETEAPPLAMIGRNNDWRDCNRNKQAKMSDFVGSCLRQAKPGRGGRT